MILKFFQRVGQLRTEFMHLVCKYFPFSPICTELQNVIFFTLIIIFKQGFTSASLTIGCMFSSLKVHDFANILPSKLFTPTCQFFCTDVFVIFMTFRITASALYHSPLFANTFLFSAHFLLLAIVEFCTSGLWECPMLLNFSGPPSPSFNTLQITTTFVDCKETHAWANSTLL